MSEEKKLSNINFFICSTYLDLKNYRGTVIEKIKSKAGIINAQEFFGSRDQKPLKTCLEEVDKSNVFIMFIGSRYGSIDDEFGKSYVELEYEEAKKKGIPKFVYLADDNYPVSPANIDFENHEKLDKFKKQLLSEHTITRFTTDGDLAEKILQDLIRELPRKDFLIGKDESLIASETTEETIRRFALLPNIYYGKEFLLTVIFNQSIQRTSVTECDAFSLNYGATVERQMVPVDEGLKKDIRYPLDRVYAEYELAEKLLDFPIGKEITVKVRTIRGYSKRKEPIYEFRKNYQYFGNDQQILVGYEPFENLIYGFKLIEII